MSEKTDYINSTLNDNRQELATMFLDVIGKEKLDWKKGWVGLGMPYNPASRRAGKSGQYHGFNAVKLMCLTMQHQYEDSRWMTYQQALKYEQESGEKCYVRKGEHGHSICFFEQVLKDKNTQKKVDWKSVNKLSKAAKEKYLKEQSYMGVSFAKYVVYNGSQIEGLEPFKAPSPDADFHKIDKIIAGCGVSIQYDGNDRAFYSPTSDEIHVPEKIMFNSENDFYGTLLHEITHSTGHSSRLNRDVDNHFGSKEYAKEELIAELGSAFIEADKGLFYTDNKEHSVEQHLAYLQSWSQMIKDDPKVLSDAIKLADEAATMVLGYEHVKEIAKEQQQKEGFSEIDLSKTLGEQTPIVRKKFNKMLDFLNTTGIANGEEIREELLSSDEQKIEENNMCKILNNIESIWDYDDDRIDSNLETIDVLKDLLKENDLKIDEEKYNELSEKLTLSEPLDKLEVVYRWSEANLGDYKENETLKGEQAYELLLKMANKDRENYVLDYGYNKTKLEINYNGENVFTGRIDLGDGDMTKNIAIIKSLSTLNNYIINDQVVVSDGLLSSEDTSTKALIEAEQQYMQSNDYQRLLEKNNIEVVLGKNNLPYTFYPAEEERKITLHLGHEGTFDDYKDFTKPFSTFSMYNEFGETVLLEGLSNKARTGRAYEYNPDDYTMKYITYLDGKKEGKAESFRNHCVSEYSKITPQKDNEMER